tara:strand:- start:112 stop:669 length:558 start_codon:yes stop_codon:yes gene_type:complete
MCHLPAVMTNLSLAIVHILLEAPIGNIPQLDAAVLTARSQLVIIEGVEIKVNNRASVSITSVHSIATRWILSIHHSKWSSSTLITTKSIRNRDNSPQNESENATAPQQYTYNFQIKNTHLQSNSEELAIAFDVRLLSTHGGKSQLRPAVVGLRVRADHISKLTNLPSEQCCHSYTHTVTKTESFI